MDSTLLHGERHILQRLDAGIALGNSVEFEESHHHTAKKLVTDGMLNCRRAIVSLGGGTIEFGAKTPPQPLPTRGRGLTCRSLGASTKAGREPRVLSPLVEG
jgi:hypothetical protein